MSSLFFYDPISVANVCDGYGVPRNMGELRGKSSFNNDGTLFNTASSSGPVSMSMFRGKCSTAAGNSGSVNRQTPNPDGEENQGRMILKYNITSYNITNSKVSSI